MLMNYLNVEWNSIIEEPYEYVAIYLQINILRAAINKLVCDGPNGSMCLGPERITQLQDNARQKLLG